MIIQCLWSLEIKTIIFHGGNGQKNLQFTIMLNYQNGEMKAEGNSITEGIGQGRVTKNLENCPLDFSFRISDNDALTIIFDLLKDEGLFLGGSSGINVAGAMKLAKELGPGHTIVTILCDSGQRYQSKIYESPQRNWELSCGLFWP